MAIIQPPAASQRFSALGATTPLALREQIGTIAAMKRLAADARFSNPHMRAVMTSPPTITATSTVDATLTRTYRVRDTNNTALNYFGGGYRLDFSIFRRFPVSTVSGADAMGSWRMEARVDSIKFQVGVYAPNAAHRWRFIVDGQYVDTTGIAAATSGTAVVQYFTVDFTAAGGRADRHIIVEGEGNSGCDGFYVLPTEGCYKVGGEILRAFGQGDSYGSAGSTRFWDGQFARLCDYLGLRDSWGGHIGGTGYVTTGGQTTFEGRLSDATRSAADVMFIQGGYNDYSGTSAALQAAALSYYRALRANSATAGIPIFVFGPWCGRRGPDGKAQADEAAIAAAVAAMNDPLIVFIPVTAGVEGPWFHGTGYQGATNGTGNSDIYVTTDGTHPSDAGHVHLAARGADAVIRALEAF